MRRGMTLPELLLVVVLLGIIMAVGAPHLVATANGGVLRETRADLLRALDAARGAAIRLGQPVELTRASGVLQLHSTITGPEAIWQVPDPGAHGVALQGLTAPIRFGAAGLATGAANRTLRLRRGTDTVVVILSRLGRIR